MAEVKWIEYQHTGYCVHTAIVGCIDIANIWTPYKGKRDYFQVRLMSKQERGKVDFSKDKHFATMDECKKYIHTEFARCINQLNTYYRIKQHYKQHYKQHPTIANYPQKNIH